MPGSRSRPDLTPERRHCLVVATTDYVDTTLQHLRAPARDATDLAGVLSDPAIGAFTVTSLVDRSAHEIRLGVEDFLDGRTPDDLVVVYLSCHGIRDKRGRLHFAATDTVRTRLAATAVESLWLLDRLDECRARRQVLVLDCCFSGAFAIGAKGEADFDIKAALVSPGRGRAVLTASRSGEYSFEGEPLGDAATGSVFTSGLVEGLRTGAADADGVGYVSVDNAYDYAFDYVSRHGASQTPQRWLYGAEGRIWLARNPARRAPALPESLRLGLDSPYPDVRLGVVATLGGWLDGLDSARAATAKLELRRIAETDIPRLASAARTFLGDDTPPTPTRTPTPVPTAAEAATPKADRAPVEAAEAEQQAAATATVPPAGGATPKARLAVETAALGQDRPAAGTPRTAGGLPDERTRTVREPDPEPEPRPPTAVGAVGRRSWQRRSVVAAGAGALTLVAAIAVPLQQWRSGTGDHGSTATTSPQGFNAAVTGIVNPSDKAGGTLKLASSDRPDSLDPARSYHPWVWNLQNGFLFRSLLAARPRPGAAGFELVPDLAQELPTTTDGGRTYTIRLRPGLRYENGSSITSRDVKYGIERVFAQDVLPGGPTYLVDHLDQQQSYPGPYKDPATDKLGLKSVSTPDDNTIVFRLQKPYTDFDRLLATPAASPVPAVNDTGAKYGDRPVSSGPYKITFIDNKKIILSRNTYWDRSTDPVRSALPDQVEVAVGVAPLDIDQQLFDGAIDLDVRQFGIQEANVPKILNDPAKKALADDVDTGTVRYVALNTKVAPFDNVHCRRAVQYAADKLAMQAARGGPHFGGDIATSMWSRTLPGEHPKVDPYGTEQGKPQLDKARDELRQCGRPDGFTTTIASRNSGREPRTAAALQQALKAVGITAKLDQIDPRLYLRTVGSPSNTKAKGYGIMFFGWTADYPSGENFLGPLVDGRRITATWNTNLAQFNDSRVNQLLDRLRSTTDDTESADLLHQIDVIVMTEAILLPFLHDRALIYRGPRLTNVFVTPYYGMVDLRSLGVT